MSADARLDPPGEVARRPYLDGLRGAAVSILVAAHLLMTFLPAAVSFDRAEAHRYPLERGLGLLPVAWLWNADFAICLFIVASGFVAAASARDTTLSVPAQAVRRYVRLAVPMLVAALLAYLVLRLGLHKNAEAAAQVTKSAWLAAWGQGLKPGVLGAVREALASAFVSGEARYHPDLWTMRLALAGPVLIVTIVALVRNAALRALLLVVVVCATYRHLVALFAVGALLHDAEGRIRAAFARTVRDERLRDQIALSGFLFGVYLGGVPDLPPGLAASGHFFLPARVSAHGWHILGASLAVASLLLSPAAKRWLSVAPARYLGRRSFSIYLVHLPIIGSLTAWSAWLLGGQPYLLNMAVGIVLTIAAVLGVAALVHRHVEPLARRWSDAAGALVDRTFPTSPVRDAPDGPWAGSPESRAA